MSGNAWRDRMVRWIACAAALLTLAMPVLGADDPGPIAQMYHSTWTARDGLRGVVTSLAQTEDGFLWVGTTEGLYRFDGMTFESYKPDAGKFPAVGIMTLEAAPDGLWIGYLSGGVSVLKDGRLTNYSERDGLPISRVRSIVHTGDGKVWVAAVGGVARLEGDHWHKVRLDWNFTAKAARNLVVDSSDTLWAATGTGILYLPKGAHRFEDAGVRAHQVTSLAPAPDGSMIYMDFTRENEPRNVCRLQMKPGGSVVRCMTLIDLDRPFVDRRGSFWFAGDSVMRLAHPELLAWNGGPVQRASTEEFGRRDGLTAYAEAMLEDQEGNIWIGTDMGLERLRPRNLRWYPSPENSGLSNLVEGDGGEIWASTVIGPVYRVATGKPIPGSPDDVRYFYREPSGALWASRSDGIWVWSGGRFVKQSVPKVVDQILPVTPMNPMVVLSAASDNSGGVWIAVGGRGEFYVKNGVWRFVPVLKDHPDWAANAAAVDEEGRLWVANDAHLAAYRDRVTGAQTEVYDDTKGPGIGPIKTIRTLPNGILIGGELGLSVYHGGEFHRIEPADGSFGRVTSIVPTPADGVWLAATPGIVHIAADEVAAAVDQPGYRVRCDVLDSVTDLPDALQGGVAQNETLRAKDGSLWFATLLGFAQVNPRLHHNLLAPPVAIRSMVADDRTYTNNLPARLPALTRNIRFDYTAMSLSIPERTRFRYKLDGLDSKWHEAGTIRQAVYDNLGPGKYTFRVIARNSDGVWNMTGATMAFTILPAWYQEDWFRAVCTMLTLLVLWATYRLRLRQMRRALTARFDERLAERTRMARELHDTFLQTIQGSKFVVDDGLEEPLDLEKMHRALGQVSGWLEQAIAEGRAALNSLRSSTTLKNDLGPALRRAAEGGVVPDGMTVSVSVIGDARELHPIVRDELYRIGNEAIQNARTHSHGSRLSIDLTYGHDLTLHVGDNGVGIDPGYATSGREGHHGLQGMRERAARIQGRLTILSSTESGTDISVIVPGSVSFLHPDGRIFSRLRSLYRRAVRHLDPL
jgi:signal transduction histidine kinase/ligand-binding sensor domain-containing protein